MAKFKVGDKVKVVRPYLPHATGKVDYVGKTFTVEDIYEKWAYPYAFAEDHMWLWRDDELELAPVVEESVVASGVVSIDYTVASAVVLVGDTHVASKLREYAKNGEEIEVVVRVKRKES